jgi:hypothetical protein
LRRFSGNRENFVRGNPEKRGRLPALVPSRVILRTISAFLMILGAFWTFPQESVSWAREVCLVEFTQRKDSPVTADGEQPDSYVDWPTQRLIKAVPKLKGMESATSQDSLPTILNKAGESVDSFLDNLANTASRERIQEKVLVLEPGSLLQNEERTGAQEFLYVVIAESKGRHEEFKEYRTDLKGRPVEKTGAKPGYMLTSGFVFAQLYLQPSHQRESAFRYLGRQSIGGRKCEILAFAQRPGLARVMDFLSNVVPLPLLKQGIIWIDSASYQIVRMQTDLLVPQTQIGLTRNTVEIEYAPVHFASSDQTLRLPSKVLVTVNFRGSIYTNRHEYSDYKLFRIETKETHD